MLYRIFTPNLAAHCIWRRTVLCENCDLVAFAPGDEFNKCHEYMGHKTRLVHRIDPPGWAAFLLAQRVLAWFKGAELCGCCPERSAK